jgi:GntR family transcriptional regulator
MTAILSKPAETNKPARADQNGIDFGRSGVSRYIQLAALFRRRIEAGHWQVNQQIPTVDELAAECGVARATVRQALDSLEEERLIERHRAKGTFVMRQPQQQLWCEMPTNWHGLLLPPKGATLELLATEKGRQPGNLQHGSGKLAPSYRYWRRLHLRNGSPYYVGDAYIDERICRRISAKALQTKTSMRILGEVEGLEIVDALQTLTIGSADLEIARLLNIPINAPVAQVHRSATDQHGTLVYVGDGVFRGDVIRLNIKLK